MQVKRLRFKLLREDVCVLVSRSTMGDADNPLLDSVANRVMLSNNVLRLPAAVLVGYVNPTPSLSSMIGTTLTPGGET